MTGLRKFGTKDLGAIVDAAERYSVGLDDIFYRLHSYGMGSVNEAYPCLLYTSPSPRDATLSRMPSSA